MEKSLVVKTARTAVSQGITNNQITSIPNKFQIQNYKNQTKNVCDLKIRKLDIVCFLVYWKLLFRVKQR
jgi:conjugal transfer/entry exclusion protein